MKASKIKASETSFSDNLTASNGITFNETGSYDIDGTAVRQINPGYDSYFYNTKTTKDMIVLHSTVGTVKGDVGTLTQVDNHCSVSFLIDRLGNIYELFSPDYWSYHLGSGAIGGNKLMSQRSIGIELSNYGPITSSGTDLLTAYSTSTSKDVYCSLSETDYYTDLGYKFRDRRYFAKYTAEQVSACAALVSYLCDKYSIEKTFLPLGTTTRFGVFPENEAKSFKGVCSHINFRSSGKWDIGPDFPWDTFTKKVIDVTVSDVPKVAEVAEVAEVEEVPEVEDVLSSVTTEITDTLTTTMTSQVSTETISSWITTIASIVKKILSLFGKN